MAAWLVFSPSKATFFLLLLTPPGRPPKRSQRHDLDPVEIAGFAAADKGDCQAVRAKKRRPIFGAIEALPAAGPASAAAVCPLLATASCGSACSLSPACL
jgi:hypothetical protein